MAVLFIALLTVLLVIHVYIVTILAAFFYLFGLIVVDTMVCMDASRTSSLSHLDRWCIH